MRVFDGFDDLPAFKSPVVTVGSYDGVHAGHRVLLEQVVRRAKEISGESVVVTFAPHPRVVLGNNSEPIWLLNSLAEKKLLLQEVGIDNLIVVRFTKEFSEVSSLDFIHKYIVGKLVASVMVVGYNHHFGHNKQGDFQYLQGLRDDFGLEVLRVDAYQFVDEKISSTVIRHLIEQGDVACASKYLAHPYFAFVHTDLHGNVLTDDPNKLLPADGDYVVQVEEVTSTISIKKGVVGKNDVFPTNSEFIITFKHRLP